MRALDERPPWREQPAEASPTRTRSRPRTARWTRPRTPEEVERVRARAAPAHRRAAAAAGRLAFSGFVAARPDGPTLAPAGGRVRTDGERLLLDCRGGALELTEVQPPGGRPMAAQAWLRGRPDPALTDFWLDPRLPDKPLDELVPARGRGVGLGRPVGAAPRGARLARDPRRAGRRCPPLAHDPDPRARSVAAYVAGQLGAPVRTPAGGVGSAAGGDGRARGPPRACSP